MLRISLTRSALTGPLVPAAQGQEPGRHKHYPSSLLGVKLVADLVGVGSQGVARSGRL